MEDPRIISALFIFLKMAYYNVLINTMQPQKKSLQKVWEWLEKYVAPSLKLFAEVGKIEQRDYIGNLIANGEMNITQKQLYEDYLKSLKLSEKRS